ncbi:MAG: hypothetical protein AAFY82_08935, partial [Pseudomonadota bacterium]
EREHYMFSRSGLRSVQRSTEALSLGQNRINVALSNITLGCVNLASLSQSSSCEAKNGLAQIMGLN